jgi:hypothetical protein
MPNVYVEAPESSQNTKDPSSKIYVKPHYCFFCKGPQKQLIRHLNLKHSCEKDVQEIEKCPKKSEQRNKLCNLIRNRGDFSHNIEVLKSEKGNLVVIRRPSSLFCPTHYYPCLSCFGFFSKNDIWRHLCAGERSNQPEGSLLRNSKVLLLSALDLHSPVLATVLADMREDKISGAVIMDPLIVKFMDIILIKNDNEKQHIVRQRGRELGRLLLHIRNSDENLNTVELRELQVPERFDLVVESVRDLATQGEHDTVSLPLKLGHSIRKLISILDGESIRLGDIILANVCGRFTRLLNAEWTDRVSSKALKKTIQLEVEQERCCSPNS